MTSGTAVALILGISVPWICGKTLNNEKFLAEYVSLKFKSKYLLAEVSEAPLLCLGWVGLGKTG